MRDQTPNHIGFGAREERVMDDFWKKSSLRKVQSLYGTQACSEPYVVQRLPPFYNLRSSLHLRGWPQGDKILSLCGLSGGTGGTGRGDPWNNIGCRRRRLCDIVNIERVPTKPARSPKFGREGFVLPAFPPSLLFPLWHQFLRFKNWCQGGRSLKNKILNFNNLELRNFLKVSKIASNKSGVSKKSSGSNSTIRGF